MQWPPRPGPGLERLEAERLRRGGLDHLPDVDPHPVAELRELVDERDVDRAVDVLEQLRQLGRLGRRDLVHGVDRACGRAPPPPSVQAGVRPPTTFGVVFVVQSVRPGSTRSGDIARWKSSPALSPLPCLEDRLHDLARRARVGRRLEHDELARLQHGARSRAARPRRSSRSGSRWRRERRRQRDQDRRGAASARS